MIFVIVKIGGVQQQSGLLADDFGDARMGVTERIDADAANEIEVTVALQIVNVASFATVECERITGIVLEQVFALQMHNFLSGGQ